MPLELLATYVGGFSFNTGNLPDAIKAYKHAVGLGNSEATPLLAISYAANGENVKAVEQWDQLSNEPRHLCSVRMLALQRPIPELGFEEQRRDRLRSNPVRHPMLRVEAIGAFHQVDDVNLLSYISAVMMHMTVHEGGDACRH